MSEICFGHPRSKLNRDPSLGILIYCMSVDDRRIEGILIKILFNVILVLKGKGIVVQFYR